MEERLTILEHDQEFFDMLNDPDLLDLTDLTIPLPLSRDDDLPPLWAPFLTDGDIADYGHYLCWLKEQNYTRSTADEYRCCLHQWRLQLDYQVTIEQINQVLRRARSRTRHQAMISALRAYAKYRHSLGDSQLYAMITLSHTLLKVRDR